MGDLLMLDLKICVFLNFDDSNFLLWKISDASSFETILADLSEAAQIYTFCKNLFILMAKYLYFLNANL